MIAMSVKSRVGKVARSRKFQIGVAAVLALGVGIAGGSASGSARAVKSDKLAAQAFVARDNANGDRDNANSQRDSAQADAVAAPAKAKAAADADNASRSSALDQRSTDLDKRKSDADARDAALTGREKAVSGAEAVAVSNEISSDGTYTVGTDVKPGTYKSSSTSGMCYWARLSSTDGSSGSILANDVSEGQSVVTIQSSDKAFKTSSCGTWKKTS